MFKKAIFSLFVLGFVFAIPFLASATTPAQEADTLIEGVVDDLAEVLWGGLGYALAIIGALMGLMFVYRFVRNRISSPK